MGPRLKLQLIKIEEGLMTGEVMFHEFIARTPEEIEALRERIQAQRLVCLLPFYDMFEQCSCNSFICNFLPLKSHENQRREGVGY